MKRTLAIAGRAAAGALLCALCCFCAEADGPQPAAPDRGNGSAASGKSPVEVRLVLPQAATRTELTADNGATAATGWSEGDRIALWAGSENGFAFEKAEFTHRRDGDDLEDNLFIGSIDPMEAGTYTYYGLYPVPAETEGGRAWFEIPAVQDGTYDGSAADILWGRSEPYAELGSRPCDLLDLVFEHKTHALKITLTTDPFEEGVSQLRIAFAKPVAGRLAVDVTTGAAELAEGSETILLQFAEPKRAGDSFWVFTAPDVDLTGTTVQLTGSGGEASYTYPAWTTAFKTLQAGHITPVNLPLTLRPQSDYTLTVTDWSHLGEPITAISELTLPAGYVFPGLEAPQTLTGLTPDEGNTFRFRMFDDVAGALAMSDAAAFDVVCESEHAEGLKVRTEAHTAESCTLTAPYLFFEDFSTVNEFSSNDKHGTSSTGSFAGIAFLDGWSGGRVGAEAGTSIRIACRRETSARYDARVDSAPMRNLRAGAEVTLRMVFDYGDNRENGGFGSANVGQTCYIGRVEDPKTFKSGDEDGTFLTENQFHTQDLNGDWTVLPHKDQPFVIPGCTNLSRITWRTRIDYNAGLNNSTCWLYIDNVRVTIVP